MDLLLLKNGRRIGVECKRIDAPRMTPSIRAALEDLELDQLFIVYPGNLAYPIAEKVSALPVSSVASIQ